MRKDFQTSQVCPLKARLPQEHKSALLDGAKTQPMWFSCRCWLRFSPGPPAANVLQQVGPLRRKKPAESVFIYNSVRLEIMRAQLKDPLFFLKAVLFQFTTWVQFIETILTVAYFTGVEMFL